MCHQVRLAGFIAGLTLFCANSVLANSLVQVQTFAGWNGSIVDPTPCSDSETMSSPGSAAVSSACGPLFPGAVTASASGTVGGGIIPNLSGKLLTSTSPFFPPFTDATASLTESYTGGLEVDGGSGPATLVLDFGLTGEGSEFGFENGASMNFSVDGGSSLSCPSLTSGNPTFGFICDNAQDYQPESVSIPVTFGVPFTFFEQLKINVSGLDGDSADAVGDTGEPSFNGAGSFFVGYSVDQNGNAVGGTLAAAPEPSALLLIPLSLCFMAWRKSRAEKLQDESKIKAATTRRRFGQFRYFATHPF
jgi:hypothetical protein